ncbi:MAG: hypothetical protein ACJ8AW_49605 [Rhodopila sp.]
MSGAVHAARKPIAMQYMPGDAPPWSIVIGNAFQYIAVVSSFLIYPLIMAREGHLTAAEADNMQGPGVCWSLPSARRYRRCHAARSAAATWRRA